MIAIVMFLVVLVTSALASAATIIVPTSVEFFRLSSQGVPPAQTVRVTATGTWKICDSMSWADTTMPDGLSASCPAGQGGWTRSGSGLFTVTPNVRMVSLAVGTYQDQITLTAGVDVLAIPVQVTVRPSDIPLQGSAPDTLVIVWVQMGSNRLEWTAPTTVVSGALLTNLIGYRVYYGQTVTGCPGPTYRMTVPSLTPAPKEGDLVSATVASPLGQRHVFQVSAFNPYGEGPCSNLAEGVAK